MKSILRIDDLIPRDAELEIKDCCELLLENWDKTIKTNVGRQKQELKKLKKAQKESERRLTTAKIWERFRTAPA